MIKKTIKKLFIIFGLTFLCIVTVLSFHEVDNSLTVEDKEYIPKYLTDITPLLKNTEYEDEIHFILQVQKSVLTIAPGNDGLSFNQKREPKELYHAKTGLCYDRSRVIEKILRYSGFKTRHISIFSTKGTKSSLTAMMTPGLSSHAVTEVLTKKSWLVVDSNNRWIATDLTGFPFSIKNIQLLTNNHIMPQYSVIPPTNIYKEPFTFIYGLYSRHGRFFPPYNAIPDVNYSELLQNVMLFR